MFAKQTLPRTSLLAAVLVAVLSSSLTPTKLFAYEGYTPTFVHALVGAAQFSEDDLTFPETSDGTSTSSNDLSTMPYLGMAFQYPLHGENTQIGVDGSFLFGWRSKSTRVRASNGHLAIDIDSALWLTDLSMGLFVKHTFGRWRTYLAAGPAIMFGEYSEDTEEDDSQTDTNEKSSNSESAFGVGAYVRGGFDFLMSRNAYIGVCVRGLQTNIEFDDAPDASSGLSGVQGFVTLSRHF